eukprot:156990-Rhodomonas_salina.1
MGEQPVGRAGAREGRPRRLSRRAPTWGRRCRTWRRVLSRTSSAAPAPSPASPPRQRVCRRCVA